MIMGAKRLGYGGETTRVENRGETTRGKRLGGKLLGGETSCYRADSHCLCLLVPTIVAAILER